MSECPHLNTLKSLTEPRLSQSVHREECTQCFDNQDSPTGVDVCLSCFNGGCVNEDRHHAQTHFEKYNHPFALNVKRRAKPRPPRDDKEPPLKKLAIEEEREQDKYSHETVVKCLACGGLEMPDAPQDPKVKALVDSVMQSMSSARQSEVKAWEEEITACEHTLMLDQSASGAILPSGLAHCHNCDLKENLWLCLTCGNLGCGRSQAGGAKGNSHGLGHFNETGHPVSVKMGTITAEGTADVYCYQCNDSRIDPELAAHLGAFGINVKTQTKTEKSITEMQIEHNLNYDFSMTGDDGKALDPVFGPGLTGLANLGNSCYMASVIQVIFSLPAFKSRFLPTADLHSVMCPEPLPASCLECQLDKLADGLLSGRYSHPREGPDPAALSKTAFPNTVSHTLPAFQEGIKPTMFKALIGKGHEEFSTMRQQDSEEFMEHFLKSLRQDAKKKDENDEDQPTRIFKFGLQQKLECLKCHKVRYRVDSQDSISVAIPAKEKTSSAMVEGDQPARVEYEPVELVECLKLLVAAEAMEYTCSSCQEQVTAQKDLRFATFPDVLVVHAKKFQLVNWVPAKLDIPVLLPVDDRLVLDALIGKGLQLGEIELEDEDRPADALPRFNEAGLDQLQGMGFSVNACQRALLATGNENVEEAMNWLFGHMEDADINDPLVPAKNSTGQEPSADQIASLGDMGFTVPQARKALKETNGDLERAIEWLFSHPDDTGDDPTTVAGSAGPATSDPGGSPALPAKYNLKAFISHKGPSVHSGHYVAHIKTEEHGWVLFNDEKVVKASPESVDELKSLAYLYFFVRE